MIRSSSATALAAFALFVAPHDARAEEPGTAAALPVLELYTSQGCSSCPAADAVLGDMVKGGKAIGLTFSVDYWDYLGWKDTLGNSQHTERQRAYAKARGGGQVFTPQLVINGVKQVVGSDRAAIKGAISASNDTISSQRVRLKLHTEGDTLLIETGGESDRSDAGGLLKAAKRKSATIWLAMVRRSVMVKIKTGENRGRLLHYANAVRAFTPVGMWNGAAMTLRLPKQALMRGDADAAVALLQVEGQGPILGAAELTLR